MPLWPSVPVSVSVGEAYQPLRMPGVSVAVVTGTSRSTFSTRKSEPTLPAWSVARTLTLCPSRHGGGGGGYLQPIGPLPGTTNPQTRNGSVYGSQSLSPTNWSSREAMPEVASDAAMLTVGFVRYQPFAPSGAAGETDIVT